VSVRILLADDHPLVRRGLREVLESEPGFEVVAEAADGAEAVDRVLDEHADLAILDVAMPRMTGLQAAEQIAKRRPTTRILLLSMYDNEQYLLAAQNAGAAGYLLKAEADEQIVAACHAALGGGGFVFPVSTSRRTRDLIAAAERGDVPAERSILTGRELEVLKLVAEGRSSQEIAATLVISIKTVERHRANMIEKLSVRDRVGLTRYAIRLGLVEP
jgi:DNA-binding NarL/FixJ family response regulator